MTPRYRVDLGSKARRQLSVVPKDVQKRIDLRLLVLVVEIAHRREAYR